MKITEVTIKLEPTNDENPDVVHTVYLNRDALKMWSVMDKGEARGLFSGEMVLAYYMQELIRKYNSGEKYDKP